MHNKAKEMAAWAMDKAKACGYDNLSSQDWVDMMNCMTVAKCAVCIDKDYRIVEAMDDAEKAERMGYNTRRYASGRYAPAGRGHVSGYFDPYMEDDAYTMGYIEDPVKFRHDMMGYEPRYTAYDHNSRMGYDGDMMRSAAGYPNNRYGEAYEGWENAKRHYTETHDTKSKDDMEKHAKEHAHRFADSMLKMYADADPKLKTDMMSEVETLAQKMKQQ